MFNIGKYDGWGKVVGDDPLGYKRDAAIKNAKSNSLLDMDLFSGRSSLENAELKQLIKKDGSLDLLGLQYSSFTKSNAQNTFSIGTPFVKNSSEDSQQYVPNDLYREEFDDIFSNELNDPQFVLHPVGDILKVDSYRIYTFKGATEDMALADIDDGDLSVEDFQ
jgi:hypothetical protein